MGQSINGGEWPGGELMQLFYYCCNDGVERLSWLIKGEKIVMQMYYRNAVVRLEESIDAGQYVEL